MVWVAKSHRGLALVLGLVLSLLAAPSFAFDLSDSIRPSMRNKAKPRGRKEASGNSLLTIGGHGFSNYLYPTVHFERALAPWVSVGITGLYSKSREGSTDALLYGGYANINLYTGGGNFRGVWLHGGYGAWTFEAKAAGESERTFRTVAMATIGFRGSVEGVLRVGIGGGILKLDPINSRLLDVTVRDTAPVITFDLGFSF